MKLSLSTIDSEPAPRRKSCSIAAIDFGTTNCSVAYTTVGSRSEKPQILPLNNTHYRVPVAVLFKTDGTIDSFGYDARKEYFNLDDKDRLKYAYFEQIKMTLQHDEVFVTESVFISAAFMYASSPDPHISCILHLHKFRLTYNKQIFTQALPFKTQ